MIRVELIKLARNIKKGFNFDKIEGFAHLGLPQEGRSFRMDYTSDDGEVGGMHTSTVQKVFEKEGNKITFETVNSVYELVLL